MQRCPGLVAGASPLLLHWLGSAATQSLPLSSCLSSAAFSTAAATSAAVGGKPLPRKFVVPDHTIEDGLPEISVQYRQDSGKRFAKRMREDGRTPACVSAFPNNFFLMLTMDAKEAAAHVRNFGRNGILSRVFKLKWEHPYSGEVTPIRALPRVIHINSQTLQLENISFAFCPPESVYDVPVPIQLWNSDTAPGVKKGGWLHVVNRTAVLRCRGSHIPPRLELDMRHMDVHDIVRFKDLQMPEGCQLCVPDPEQPVVRCTMKVGGD